MLHEFLDVGYGQFGGHRLKSLLKRGADPNEASGPLEETPLHIAARRRRLGACRILVAHGAQIDAKTTGGKTAYVHAARRGFTEIGDYLVSQGASTEASEADRLAIAISRGHRAEAEAILASKSDAARTGNPEEDRLLADVAGRNQAWPVDLLVKAGAHLACRGMDDGTPLHQAAWFGQPHQARTLIDAGAPVDVFDRMHNSSPLGWAVHGSRHSGGARRRQVVYVDLIEILLQAGSALRYPGDGSDAYYQRLLATASPPVRRRLVQFTP